MKVFRGIDWSERHHDVALVDQDGTLIAKRRIGESVEDFAELLTLLAEADDSAVDMRRLRTHAASLLAAGIRLGARGEIATRASCGR